MALQSAVIIGTGNVATHLAQMLPAAGCAIVEVYGRTPEKALQVATLCGASHTSNLNALKPADIYIIAVTDSAIQELAVQMQGEDKFVVHTSGSTALDVLNNFTKRGVFYPLQTFTGGTALTTGQFPVLTEASSPLLTEQLNMLAHDAGLNPIPVSSADRLKVHTAAVFACNFSNHMYVIAEKLLAEASCNLDILRPLMSETFNKALSGSPAEAQTGPALRKDQLTVQKHIDNLASHPVFKDIYSLISKSITHESETRRH